MVAFLPVLYLRFWLVGLPFTVTRSFTTVRTLLPLVPRCVHSRWTFTPPHWFAWLYTPVTGSAVYHAPHYAHALRYAVLGYGYCVWVTRFTRCTFTATYLWMRLRWLPHAVATHTVLLHTTLRYSRLIPGSHHTGYGLHSSTRLVTFGLPAARGSYGSTTFYGSVTVYTVHAAPAAVGLHGLHTFAVTPPRVGWFTAHAVYGWLPHFTVTFTVLPVTAVGLPVYVRTRSLHTRSAGLHGLHHMRLRFPDSGYGSARFAHTHPLRLVRFYAVYGYHITHGLRLHTDGYTPHYRSAVTTARVYTFTVHGCVHGLHLTWLRLRLVLVYTRSAPPTPAFTGSALRLHGSAGLVTTLGYLRLRHTAARLVAALHVTGYTRVGLHHIFPVTVHTTHARGYTFRLRARLRVRSVTGLRSVAVTGYTHTLRTVLPHTHHHLVWLCGSPGCGWLYIHGLPTVYTHGLHARFAARTVYGSGSAVGLHHTAWLPVYGWFTAPFTTAVTAHIYARTACGSAFCGSYAQFSVIRLLLVCSSLPCGSTGLRFCRYRYTLVRLLQFYGSHCGYRCHTHTLRSALPVAHTRSFAFYTRTVATRIHIYRIYRFALPSRSGSAFVYAQLLHAFVTVTHMRLVCVRLRGWVTHTRTPHTRTARGCLIYLRSGSVGSPPRTGYGYVGYPVWFGCYGLPHCGYARYLPHGWFTRLRLGYARFTILLRFALPVHTRVTTRIAVTRSGSVPVPRLPVPHGCWLPVTVGLRLRTTTAVRGCVPTPRTLPHTVGFAHCGYVLRSGYTPSHTFFTYRLRFIYRSCLHTHRAHHGLPRFTVLRSHTLPVCTHVHTHYYRHAHGLRTRSHTHTLRSRLGWLRFAVY